MTSYRQNNQKTPFLGVVFAVAALCSLVFAIDYVTGGGIKAQAQRVGAATRLVFASAATAVHDNAVFSTRRALQVENDALQRELDLARERLLSHEMVRNENEELRALVNLAGDGGGVTARLISSYRATPYGTFMIDAGSREGVVEGALVLTDGGYVVGRIVDVTERAATVQSIFAPGEQVDLIIGEIAFTADGKGSGNAEAMVPREAELSVGDVARAPTYDNRAAGIIGRIDSASSSATQTMFLRLPVNLGLLQFVHVINR